MNSVIIFLSAITVVALTIGFLALKNIPKASR